MPYDYRKANDGGIRIRIGINSNVHGVHVILHSRAATKYSLVFGEIIDKTSNVLKFHMGDVAIIGIMREMHKYPVRSQDGRCTEYDLDDSRSG